MRASTWCDGASGVDKVRCMGGYKKRITDWVILLLIVPATR